MKITNTRYFRHSLATYLHLFVVQILCVYFTVVFAFFVLVVLPFLETIFYKDLLFLRSFSLHLFVNHSNFFAINFAGKKFLCKP